MIVLVLVLGQAAVGIFGHSYALISEAIESGADVLSAGIAWLGLRMATRKPGENCLYGHGKAEPLVAIVVSVVLWGCGPLRLTLSWRASTTSERHTICRPLYGRYPSPHAFQRARRCAASRRRSRHTVTLARSAAPGPIASQAPSRTASW